MDETVSKYPLYCNAKRFAMNFIEKKTFFEVVTILGNVLGSLLFLAN